MGLDVYLYRNATGHSLDAIRAAEHAWEEATEAIYEAIPGDTADDQQRRKDMADERFAAGGPWTGVLTRTMGGNTWEVTAGVECIDVKSAKHPEHLFEVGYWRSSYNEGGINNVLRRHGLLDLFQLAGVDEERFPEDGPIDWQACIKRTKATIDAIGQLDTLDVERIYPPLLRVEPTTPAEALDLYRQQVAGDHSFSAWSSREGVFWPNDPQCLLALIHGQRDTYLIVERPFHPSYVKSLEVVIETCEYVLAQPNPQEFYLHWSG